MRRCQKGIEGVGVVKEGDASLEMVESGIPRMFVGAAEPPCPCARVQPWSAIASLLFHLGFPNHHVVHGWVLNFVLLDCCSLTQSSQFWAPP